MFLKRLNGKFRFFNIGVVNISIVIYIALVRISLMAVVFGICRPVIITIRPRHIQL